MNVTYTVFIIIKTVLLCKPLGGNLRLLEWYDVYNLDAGCTM